MALSINAFMASLLLLLLAAHLVDTDAHVVPGTNHYLASGGRSLMSSIDCAAACQLRCSKSWKQKMCHKTCGTCCSRCSCVPPGTSVETRSICPCYANMKTHGNRFKCP